MNMSQNERHRFLSGRSIWFCVVFMAVSTRFDLFFEQSLRPADDSPCTVKENLLLIQQLGLDVFCSCTKGIIAAVYGRHTITLAITAWILWLV
mgnify:FL=1